MKPLWHRHRHQYEECERRFTPPVPDHDFTMPAAKGTEALFIVEKLIDIHHQTIFGFTTIISRCHCGALHQMTVLGDQTIPVEDSVIRADLQRMSRELEH